jgi:hypothetical protein
MNKNNVKLLVQRYRSTTDQIQNSSVSAIEAHIHRDGLRAVDSGEFLIPTGVPVSEGDIVKWIQDDADVTHLRSCYLFQGSLKDEGGWEADGENSHLDARPQTATWTHETAGKFKGLLRINSGTEAKKCSTIPNKLMYVNKTVSGGNTTANVHDFDGDFEIDIWVTATSNVAQSNMVLFGKTTSSYNSGKRVVIYQGSSGQIQADIEDGDSHEVNLTTGSKIQKASAANFVRLQRKGNKFSLWLVNGSELSDTLFTTPDDTETNELMEVITTTTPTTIGGYWNGSAIEAANNGYRGIINSVRIYCGGVLSLGDARALYKARAAPLVMKLAGTVWKIKDLSKGKKLFVTGFGKVIPETNIDTKILNSGTSDSGKIISNALGSRIYNVYLEETAQNIIYSMLTMLNTANTTDANSAATSFNKLELGYALSSSARITKFIAEGNLLSLIKILLTRAAIQGGTTYSFFISPRGVCILEELGIDRGVTFNHDPYNIQVSAGDDTYTVNDLTVTGRIPVKCFVRNESSQGLGTGNKVTFSNSEIGTGVPSSVRIYDKDQSEWLSADHTSPQFTVNPEERSVIVNSWESGSGSHDVDFHVDYEYIDSSEGTPNLKQFKDASSITGIGRYKKKIYVPQLTEGVDIKAFGINLLDLTKDINKRYTVKAPFLVNFVRENHKVNVKNTLKNINVTGKIVKSIHWHYPKNETIIEVGEHEANAYDLVVRQNETVNSLTAQSLKSMNRFESGVD